MSEGRDYIPRTLSWTDAALKTQTVRDHEIVSRFSEPVVILGDPGIGKTWLMEMLGEQNDHQFIRATSLLRQPDGNSFANSRLVIDGLDEVAAINEGDPLHNVLTKLIACGKPPFILSCRSAEWRGVSAKIDIADEYGAAPRDLNLELLDEDEAVSALERRADQDKARSAIHALKQAGLSEFFRNPLYLDFVAAIINGDGALPSTRAQLYERAVAQLRLEGNPRHQGKGVDALSENAALDAAGAIMAAMLITGQSCIVASGSVENALKLSELSDICDLDPMKAVLRSNLFRALPSGNGQFMPLHRTVAEFLGARWLAKHVDSHNSARQMANRIVGLIAAEGGVPSSLRGLHAWFPKFSPTRLGPGAIDRDPYGVIRYGDGDGLNADQARKLIEALRQLAVFDPWFRDSYWASEAIGALAQPSLLDEIRALVRNEGEHVALRCLILEAVVGNSVSAALQDDLEAIMLNPKRVYRERRAAGEAIADIVDNNFDWPKALKYLLSLKDHDSARLATELLDDMGFEKIPVELVASVIIANGRLFEKKSRETRTFGTFFRLQKQYPIQRVAELLDALAAKIVPRLDPKKWWSDGYDDRWGEFAGLVRKLCIRQLEHDAEAVTPDQLWRWLRMVEREYTHGGDERKAIAEFLQKDDRLRRGGQRLSVLSPESQKAFFAETSRLHRLSSGFAFTDDDAKALLAEVVEKGDPEDRERWMALVAHFRADGVIPVEIRKFAQPYAQGDQELLDFLVKKPKRQKLDEWEIKHRKTMRAREKRENQGREKARTNYAANIDAIRHGELRWIYAPAQACLGMYRDHEREGPPADRISEWLGNDIRDAALEGFEAVLHRDDLPSADQIASSYAESRVWNFVYPMLAGAGQRFLSGQGFDDLSDELVSALAIACEHELLSGREQFEGLEEALNDQLRKKLEAYETHLRRKIEPMLKANRTHIHGLYRLTRTDGERPLSMRLSLEWLQRFPDLPLDVERDLVGCLLYAPAENRADYWPELAAIAKARLSAFGDDDEKSKYWRGIQFSLNFDDAVKNFPTVLKGNREWLWYISRPIYQRHSEREHYPSASLRFLAWLATTFRTAWPYTNRPSGTTSGDQNSWDATELIEWAIYQIAKDPSDDAAVILRLLRDAPEDGYTTTIQANIANQRRTRLEAHFKTPSLTAYKAVLSASGAPQSAADVQAIVLSELAYLQERLRGDPLNLVNNFYDDTGRPRDENACRDQLLIALGPTLPFNIQTPPEVAMPQGNRSDGAFAFGDISVPLECKGQWHKDVWTAAATQLDRFYSIEHKAAKKGIYVVFWFGADAPAGKRLKLPPNDAPKPESAHDMQLALQTLLPIERRADIAVVVLDLTRP
jgi:hypothetical protein